MSQAVADTSPKTQKLVKQGVVVSDSMDKTIVVIIHRYKKHPKYQKRYRVSKKFFVHDPEGKCKVGDKVRIVETRPLSKLKRWEILEILE